MLVGCSIKLEVLVSDIRETREVRFETAKDTAVDARLRVNNQASGGYVMAEPVMYPVRQTYKAQLIAAFTSLLVHVFPYCTDFVLLSKSFSSLLQATDRISRGLVFFMFSSR